MSENAPQQAARPGRTHRESPDPYADQMERLDVAVMIEGSSLGTPAARRLRRQTSANRVAEILYRRDQLASQQSASSLPRVVRAPSSWWESPVVTSRPFGPDPKEARTVRRFARELLTSWGLGSLSDDAEIIVGELAANAIWHGLRSTSPVAPGALRLCLLRGTGEVMLAVLDPSDEAPVLRQLSSTDEGGRGLQIVDALSYVWGWSPIAGHGKAVWAILLLA